MEVIRAVLDEMRVAYCKDRSENDGVHLKDLVSEPGSFPNPIPQQTAVK